MEMSYTPLPLPKKVTSISIEEAILIRRSIRRFKDEPISLEQLSMILWAAYGITDHYKGFRATPSAGATYPLEIYTVIGERGVAKDDGGYVDAGVYKYVGELHALRLVRRGDYRDVLAKAALGQQWVRRAPVDMVMAAVFERTTRIYGERGRLRYVPMEVGHAGQNIYLMATALGLGTVAIGAFIDDKVAEIVVENRHEVPVYIMPVGKPAEVFKVVFEDIENYIMMHRRGVA
jgi:SagB-type dehydrogenase family enzyme